MWFDDLFCATAQKLLMQLRYTWLKLVLYYVPITTWSDEITWVLSAIIGINSFKQESTTIATIDKRYRLIGR